MSRHRRCTRPRHHIWAYFPTFTGWSIARCTNCPAWDLA